MNRWENWADVFEDCGKLQSTPHFTCQCKYAMPFFFFFFSFCSSWFLFYFFSILERHREELVSGDAFSRFYFFGGKRRGLFRVAMSFLPSVEKPFRLFKTLNSWEKKTKNKSGVSLQCWFIRSPPSRSFVPDFLFVVSKRHLSGENVAGWWRWRRWMH